MGNEPLTLDQAQAAVDALAAHDGNIARTARYLGMSRSTLRSRLQVADKYGVEPGEGNTEALPSPLGPTLRQHDGPRVYVVTAAQNATPVHADFHAALRRYCKERGATLVVIPFRYRNPCLSPETRALTSDLRWVPVGELQVGDTLVGFDENLGDGERKNRQYKTATVKGTGREIMYTYRVTFDDGTSVIASENHPWLVNMGGRQQWRETKDLVHHKGGSHVIRLFDTWEEDESWESGYIAAALDGEGSLMQQSDHRGGWQFHLTFVQKQNEMTDKMKGAMSKLGADFRLAGTKNGCSSWHIYGGRPEIIRVLGKCRPPRLLEKLDTDRLGEMHKLRTQKVVSCDPIGMNEVVTLATDTQTLIAEGLATHNTSVFPASQQNQEHWDAEIAEELVAEDVPLNDNLLLAAGMKIQPTAKRPLSGLQTYSEDKSAVFGHTKIELETVATPQNTLPKILTTTGAVTQDNYTDTKAGRLGEHHHVLGAAVVEVESDEVFHLRQINACEDGSFVDLDREYTPRSSRKAPRPLALTCGDVHHAQMDPDVEASVFGEGGLVDELRPRHLVLHDLLDFKSQGHHDAGNFFEMFRKHRLGIDGVYDEVSATLEWTNDVAQRVDEVAVVQSNHNEAFTRWLNDGRGDKDPKNAWFYHATWSGILPAPWEDGAEIGNPIEYWYHRWYGEDNVRFLKRNEPYVIGGVDHHMHGDVGTNGAKGSLTQFNKLGVRSTSGHNHGPGIHGGAHQVGVMQLYMGYNEYGPSNWLPTHSLLYHNGKRTLVTSVKRDYRARFPMGATP